MNWRATYILTGRRDLAIVPNSTIAKSKIVNVSSPSGIHGTTVTVQVDATTPPAIAGEILDHAILNCQLIITNPAPTVTVKTINAGYTEFDITFFVEELASSVKAQNELFDLIFRHLAAAGMNLASPQGQPGSAAADNALQRARTGPEKLLDLVAIFATLAPDERMAIAAKLQQHSYDKGETLVEPGTVLQSLFIVGSGVLSLIRDEIEGEMEVTRLGPGDHFGEIGLLTGAAATVKINALVPTAVYELAKADLTPILEAQPQAAQELCRAFARRQAAGRLIASAELNERVPVHSLTSWFADRIHRLYDTANAK